MDGTPNPITALRDRYAISQARLAEILDLPERYVDVLEMHARSLPAQVLALVEDRIRAREGRCHE